MLSQKGKEMAYQNSVNYKALVCHTPSTHSNGSLFDLTEGLRLILSFFFNRTYMTFKSCNRNYGKCLRYVQF